MYGIVIVEFLPIAFTSVIYEYLQQMLHTMRIVVQQLIHSAFLCWCWTCMPLFAQESTFSSHFGDQTRWTHFTTESGLPSNQIYQIFEGRDGTMWASTSKGLAYYDEFQWVAIDSPKGIHQSLLLGIFYGMGDRIIASNNLNIFIGTKDGFQKLPVENVINAVPSSERYIIAVTQQ